MKLFFVLLSLFFMSACFSVVYTCKDETGFRDKTFAFDDEKSTINRSSFYYTKKSIKQPIIRGTLSIDRGQSPRSMWLYEYHDPLVAKIGAYNAKKSEEEIIVHYVLEDVFYMSQLPSGEIVDKRHDRNRKNWSDWSDKLHRSGEYSHWVDFAIQILTVEKYVFNISKKTLTVFNEYPFPPEKGEKTSWKFKNGQSLPKHLGSMNKEELAHRRFYPQKTRIYSYPDCSKLNLLELFLYHTVYFIFAW